MQTNPRVSLRQAGTLEAEDMVGKVIQAGTRKVDGSLCEVVIA